MTSELRVGIDLGTTYSAVAHIDESGSPKTVQNSEGAITTPSVVLFEDLHHVVVGRYAKSDAVRSPERVVECIKRQMGRRDFDFTFEGRRMYPETISALILKKLKQDAEQRLGPIAGVVITVPAYFDDPRRTATYNAGEIAGLNVMNIINEPTAAALAYGNRSESELETAMVYDLGGGTFDVTVVKLGGDNIRALATGGAVVLGGKNWDDALIEFVANEFIKEHGLDPREDPDSHQELVDKVVDAKEKLSFRASLPVRIRHGGKSFSIDLTRDIFKKLTDHLLGQTQMTAELVLEDAALDWGDVDKVLMVGGSTRMPMVREMLQQISGQVPDTSLEPDEVVAWGAAIHANVLAGSKRFSPRRREFSDVNSHSLGVAALDPKTGEKKNVILIPKNTNLHSSAAHKTRDFKLRDAGARRVAVEVLEGEAEEAEAAVPIAKCYIKDLPEGLPKGTIVKVTYGYQPDGRVNVTALVPETGHKVSMQIQRTGGLTEDQIAEEREYVERTEVS